MNRNHHHHSAQQQESEDEALARALQLQYEREAAASAASFAAAPPPSRSTTTLGGSVRQPHRSTFSTSSSNTKKKRSKNRTGEYQDQDDDEAYARRLAAEQESAGQAAAAAAAVSNRRLKSSSRNNGTVVTNNSGGFVFPTETEHDNHINSGGYVFPVPTASESISDETDEDLLNAPHHTVPVFHEEDVEVEASTMAPARPLTEVELSDLEYAQRVEQELRDELVAERLQQREAQRINQRRAHQMQHDEQQRAAVVVAPPPQQRKKRIYGSLITIALVVGAVVALVYYFVVLGGGVPNINLTPEDFANEDPYNEMDPSDANAWSNNGNGVSLTVINALETKWYQYFYDAIDDWDNGYPDTLTLSTDFNQVAGAGSHDAACSTISGRVKVCNGNYGNTHWKGINEVLIDGNGFIVASAARMNEFYLGNNDDDQMQYTMCHELGHAWGLPHTDETFGNPDLGDCMDYTNNPQTNRQPTIRNFVFLWNMYGTVPGAQPYTPPTPAPSPPPPTAVVVAQNSSTVSSTSSTGNSGNTGSNGNGGGTRHLPESTVRTSTASLRNGVWNKNNNIHRILAGRPLPDWLTDAMDQVLDRPQGRRLQASQWRLLHAHEHGEAHEIDLPQGYKLRVRYLKAATTSDATSTNAQEWTEP
ncbi:hypothetical protein ACA910_022464 [Epithemia clementina (nom. ined.)]